MQSLTAAVGHNRLSHKLPQILWFIITHLFVLATTIYGIVKAREVLAVLSVAATLALLLFWEQVSALAALRPRPRPLTASHPWTNPSRLLPYKYWEHRRLHPDRYNQISCTELPQPTDIHYAAASWQRLPVTNGSVYVYGAYWDDRFVEPLVRVLVYCDVTPLPPLACQFWYEDENAPISEPAKVTYGWQSAWGGPTSGVNEPYILSCRARRHPPDAQRAPTAVSITPPYTLCTKPFTLLAVQGAPSELNPTPRPLPAPSTVCVCLKWLQFREDNSAELVEWIEFIKVFGASKLFVFVVQVHPNTQRVLEHYERSGFADVSAFAHAPQLRSNFSPSSQNFHDFRRELLPLNDCLLRARTAGYHWLAVFDSDEIIVPLKYDTWQEVISTHAADSGVDALVFRHYYFLDAAQRDLAAPPHFRILGHRWRARVPHPLGHNIKSFHNTSSVVAMHNHYPLSCGARRCQTRAVPDDIARLHHYRRRCGDNTNNCSETRDTVRDDALARWAPLAAVVRRALRNAGLSTSDT